MQTRRFLSLSRSNTRSHTNSYLIRMTELYRKLAAEAFLRGKKIPMPRRFLQRYFLYPSIIFCPYASNSSPACSCMLPSSKKIIPIFFYSCQILFAVASQGIFLFFEQCLYVIRRGAVVKGIEHISPNLKVNI